MGRKSVKEYSTKFKTKVVLEALKNEETQTEICSKYKIPNSTLSTWTKQFLDNADDIFNSKQIERKHRLEVARKEEHIDELHKTIGKLTVSVDFLKKKHREAGIPYPKEFDRYQPKAKY